MQRRAFLTTTLTSAVLLTSCVKSPGGPAPLDEWKPLLRLAVTVGVDRLLTGNERLVPLAVRVTKILVDAVDGGQFTSVAEVAALLQRVIPWDKVGADSKPLLEALIAAVADELQVIASRYNIPVTAQLLVVKEIFQWANDVALRHAATPVKVRRVG